MELIKNKIPIVNYFLPRNSKLVTVKNNPKEPAILEGDLDQDGYIELMALYKKDEKYYVMVLRSEHKKWYMVWNRAVKYKSIQYFKVVHLQSTQRCEVAIAGKIEGMSKSRLMLFVWKGEEIQPLLKEYIAFDKLYIEDVDELDGKDEIVLWQNKVLEAYDVHIYRYQEAELIEDKSLDAFYYPILVKYYQNLKDSYPGESVYEIHLEEILAKCKSGTSNKTGMNFLLGMSAYLEKIEVEEDVFLMGKKEKDTDYFINLQLMATYARQTKNQLIRLEVERVYDYEMKVGRFLEGVAEQIFIKVNSNTQEAPKKCWVIGLDHGYLYDYLQHVRDLETTESIESSGECYAIEMSMKEPLMIGMRHRMWDHETHQIAGYKLRVFKGEKSGFKLYKTFVIREEEGG